jgi:hypothetical protein
MTSDEAGIEIPNESSKESPATAKRIMESSRRRERPLELL